jgi:outer membrane receptor protein involved in Fe transport
MKMSLSARLWLLLGLVGPLVGQTTVGNEPGKPGNDPVALGETVELSPFLVSRQRDRGYAARTSLGASRVAMDTGDIPASVISLNEQLFADLGAVDAMEVLPFASGVARISNSAPGQEAFALRGYAVTGLRLRDGLPELLEGTDQPYDDSSVYDRVEILKGPAGTLYGTTSMGGIVNKISKWPQFTAKHTIELQAQSYDEFIRGMVDSTGPLNENTAYRAVLSSRTGTRYYAKNDAPNDFTNALVALTHLSGDKKQGKIWGRFQYLKVELDTEAGPQYTTGYLDPLNPAVAPVVANPKIPVAVDANLYPEDDVSQAKVTAFEAGYEHGWSGGPLNGDWTLRLVARYSDGQGDKGPSFAAARPVPIDVTGAIVKYTNAAGASVNGDSRFIGNDDPRVADWRATMTVREFAGYTTSGGGFLDLVGDFDTGPLKHKLILNSQLTTRGRERAFFFWNMPNPANTTALANSFSMVDPDYTGVDIGAIEAGTPSFNAFDGHVESVGFASGFQDNISAWADRLIAVVGARYDHVDSTSYTFDSAQSIAQRRFVQNPTTTRKAGNQDWTFKYGLVGKPLPGLSIFAQLAETYIPISTLDPTGNKYPNQDGETREIGFKTDFLNGRLAVTASVFKMELTNVLISVPNPPELGGGLVQVPAGTQKTDGFEIDIAAEPLRGLNVMLAYSDLKSTDALGRSFRGVSIDPTWSTLIKYRFTESKLRGAFLGGSWVHRGRSPGDPTNTFYIDKSDTFDAFVGYGRDRWSVQVNAYNVTNSDDVITTVGDTAMFRPLERMYRLTLRYTF